MRGISSNFLSKLKYGFLSDIVKQVLKDKDLDFEIRDNYINIYFKGNSLIKLSEANTNSFNVEINDKFKNGLVIPNQL